MRAVPTTAAAPAASHAVARESRHATRELQHARCTRGAAVRLLTGPLSRGGDKVRQCRHTAVSGAMPWLRWPTAEYGADQSVLTYTHCGTAYTVDPPDYLGRPAAGSSWPCGSSPPAAAAPPPTPARLSVGLSIGAPPSHSSARSVDRVRAVDTHSESSACPRLLGWYGSA
jgi:hypothetical protein